MRRRWSYMRRLDDINILTEVKNMQENAELAKKVLLDLKVKVHNNTVYPNDQDTYAFVSTKVVDALIRDEIKKLEEMQ